MERLKLYTWKLCETVVDGIQNLKKELRGNAHSYPTIETSTDLPPYHHQVEADVQLVTMDT